MGFAVIPAKSCEIKQSLMWTAVGGRLIWGLVSKLQYHLENQVALNDSHEPCDMTTEKDCCAQTVYYKEKLRHLIWC